MIRRLRAAPALFLVCSVALGCAQPKYIQNGDSGAEGQSSATPQEKAGKADCTLIFKTSGVCLSWWWIEEPVERAKGKLVFKTFRANLFDSTPIQVDLTEMPGLFVFMPTMGHPSRPTTVSRLDSGTYLVENVVFTMVGPWELRFQELQNRQVVDEVVVPLVR